MLIKGISSLKFCAYVGRESKEDESGEILGLEAHKLAEQYEFETDDGDFKAPAPSLFKQPPKKDKARILQLLKTHNEKRRLIKLLEKKNINSERNDSSLPIEVLTKVENALQKILQKEIQSLYQEVKNIISTNSTNTANPSEVPNNENKSKAVKNRWPLRSLDNSGAKLSAVIEQPVNSEEDGAYELDEHAVNVTSDGIADDRGTIDHNHFNDTSLSNEESSFSSSEEAMLHCRGVLLSQPLVPENQCDESFNPRFNNIKYTIEEDGYYYFIFSSANEKVKIKFFKKYSLIKLNVRDIFLRYATSL